MIFLVAKKVEKFVMVQIQRGQILSEVVFAIFHTSGLSWDTLCPEMVFCYQNCSDLLWEKIVLSIRGCKNIHILPERKRNELIMFCKLTQNVLKHLEFSYLSGLLIQHWISVLQKQKQKNKNSKIATLKYFTPILTGFAKLHTFCLLQDD